MHTLSRIAKWSLPVYVLAYAPGAFAQTPGEGEGEAPDPTAAPRPADETTPPAPSPPDKSPVPGNATPNTPPAGTPHSEFMDTRLAFTCSDEDMLRDPTVLPTAPGFHCGQPSPLGILFFDNYDTRFSGFETLSHIALYKHYNAGHWDIEGGFVVLMNEFAEDNIRFTDGGSYIRAAYWFDADRKEPGQISLVAFPVSSDRMRLGYSYRISWGGSPEFFKANPDVVNSVGTNSNAVPGAKLQYDNGKVYAYVGISSTELLDPVINEQVGVLAFMAGAGWDVTPFLRIEANGGVFDRGKNQAEDVLGEPVTLYGASAQVTLHHGIPVGSSIDYALYRNDPESIARLFKKETYPGGLSWLISSEATRIYQTLKDPQNAGSTRTQTGYAADLNVRVKLDYWRFRVDFMTRDLGFILHSIPSLPTYWDFPDAYTLTSEYFGAVGLDRYFAGPALTAGVTFGADLPATLKAPNPSDIPGNLSSSTTLVIRDQSSRSVLPTGSDVGMVFAAKGSFRKDFGDAFALLFDLYYQYDPNTVRYDRSANQGNFNTAQFASFNQLGFDVTFQARF